MHYRSILIVICLICFVAIDHTKAQTWEQTNGPYGGLIRSIVVSQNGHIFAMLDGLDGGAVFKSANNGALWVPADNGLTGVGVRCLTVSPTGRVFTGGNDLYVSDDNGDSWDNAWSTQHPISAVASDPTGIMYMADGWAVYRSVDNGETWVETSFSGNVDLLATNHEGMVFAVISFEPPAVFRSADYGDTWELAYDGHPGKVVFCMAVASNNDILVGTFEGVFRSSDNAATWVQVNNGLWDSYISAITIDPGGTLFAGTGDGVFRSTDNGDSWLYVSDGLTNRWVTSLAISADGSVLAGTGGTGVFRSVDNGNNWVQSSHGLLGSIVFSLAVNSNEAVFAGTMGGGIFRYDNGTGEWTGSTLSDWDCASQEVGAIAINADDC